MNEDSRAYFREQAEKVRGNPAKAKEEKAKANKLLIFVIVLDVIILVGLGFIIYKLLV